MYTKDTKHLCKTCLNSVMVLWLCTTARAGWHAQFTMRQALHGWQCMPLQQWHLYMRIDTELKVTLKKQWVSCKHSPGSANHCTLGHAFWGSITQMSFAIFLKNLHWLSITAAQQRQTPETQPHCVLRVSMCTQCLNQLTIQSTSVTAYSKAADWKAEGVGGSAIACVSI